MKKNRLVWVLVLSLMAGVMAPGAVYADPETSAVESGEVRESKIETDRETEIVVETESARESKNGKETVTDRESKNGKETVTDREIENGRETVTDEETEILVETETGIEVTTEEETLFEEAMEEEESTGSNEELIALQNIVMPDNSVDMGSFLFTWMEDAPEAFLESGANVYEEQSEDARIIGRSFHGSNVYVLEKGSSWCYIESGRVRGFVPREALAMGQTLSGAEDAFALVSPMKNRAIAYTRTTAMDPAVNDPDYAVAADIAKIYGSRDLDGVVGTIPEGGVACVLAECEDGVIFVESGEVRGFVDSDLWITGSAAASRVEEKGADHMARAAASVRPQDNPARYYTLTSTAQPGAETVLRANMTDFAQRFVGNPYVWGGTSLTDGCDCSGFVQQIYEHFGYELPRTSQVQARHGMQIPVEAALPGDLIFYAQEGKIYHVSMYIGDGKVVHAMNEETGITVSSIGSNAVWATRVIGG